MLTYAALSLQRARIGRRGWANALIPIHPFGLAMLYRAVRRQCSSLCSSFAEMMVVGSFALGASRLARANRRCSPVRLFGFRWFLRVAFGIGGRPQGPSPSRHLCCARRRGSLRTKHRHGSGHRWPDSPDFRALHSLPPQLRRLRWMRPVIPTPGNCETVSDSGGDPEAARLRLSAQIGNTARGVACRRRHQQ